MDDVVITSAARTPVGGFGKSLRCVSAVDLGSIVIKEVLNRSGISVDDVDEVVLGCVLQAGLGQNVSRQCAIKAGLPVEVPAMTIDQVCGTGLRSVMLGAQLIKAGDANIVVVGGTENMSQAPYVVQNARFGPNLNGVNTVDEILLKITDSFYDCQMGITAENLVDKFSISRDEQDRFSYWSRMKAKSALESGRFNDEICSVKISSGTTEHLVSEDECIRLPTSLDRMNQLKPAFKTNGSVTAANSSGINDGAAALVLMGKRHAQKIGAPILCEIASYEQSGVDPAVMGYAPVPAITNVLAKAGLTLSDIDLIELNEAFAAQTLAVVKGLHMEGVGEISGDKLNVNGGALAIGAPMAAGGARILITLLYEMIKRNSRTGMASLCMGGGMGAAMIIKRNGDT